MAKNQIDLARLRPVMDRDYRELQAFREKRLKHVAEYIGSEYGLGNCVNPVNVVSQFVNTFVHYLVGDNARAFVSTFDRTLRPFAEAMMDWMNPILKQMRFSDVLATSVLHGMFLIGITYTAITAPVEARFGYYRQAGEPGVFNIDFQDFICDTSVSCFEECEYQGHFYWANYDDVKSCTLFKSKVRNKVEPEPISLFNKGGDYRINTLASYAQGDAERYEEYVRLGQVWFPRYNKVLTFLADGDDEDVLLEQEWVGPKCGPYQFLKFQDVPGKLLPKGPVMDIILLAKSINEHWKHLDNQASQQKDLVVYQDEGDAHKLERVKQGAYVALKNPAGVVPLKMFGPNQELSTWAGIEAEKFNEMAGNPRALGGLSTSAKTATQEKLISESASKFVQSMGKKTTSHAQNILECLGWFNWNNPHQTFESTYELPGMPGVTADRSVSPQARMSIPWEKMQLEFDAYSLQFVAPGDRANILDGLMKNIVIPFAPLIPQPGMSEALQKYFKLTAKYRNMPEIMEIVEPLFGAQGDPQTTSPDMPELGQPGEQTTTHERVSRPGMTDTGHMQELQQQMANGQTNQGEQAGAMVA